MNRPGYTAATVFAVALFGIGGMMAGCSAPLPAGDDPVAVATAFVTEYSRWAQDGYPSPIPGALLDCADEATRAVLEDDRAWNTRGQIRHQGPTRVLDAELSDLSNGRAVVAVTLDTTDLMVLAEGEPTFMSDQKIHITEFILVRTDRWRVAGAAGGER